MRNRRYTGMVLALCLAILAGGLHCAFAGSAAGVKPQTSTPGVEMARTLSLITGVAISPLLGVGAVGAYHYWNTPAEKRAGLPWYAQPWFWIPALALVALVGVKDILGTAAPTVLKKPFDVAETMENKISGLVAAGAFLPLVVSVFPETAGNEAQWLNLSPLAASSLATVDAGAIGNALLVPFALAVFVVVWLASHAINILILLSPFTTLDTILKGFRLGLLSLVGASSFANPWLGGAVAFAVVVVAYFVAGWSLRLTVLGTVYVWDFITFRRHRFQPGAESNRMFTAREMEGAPARTYGRLVCGADGSIVFEYRSWLILPRKRFTLQKGHYVVGRGIFYPILACEAGGMLRTLFIMPPRYRGHEDAMARTYGLAEVRDMGLLKGVKAAWNWLKNLSKDTGTETCDKTSSNPTGAA